MKHCGCGMSISGSVEPGPMAPEAAVADWDRQQRKRMDNMARAKHAKWTDCPIITQSAGYGLELNI